MSLMTGSRTESAVTQQVYNYYSPVGNLRVLVFFAGRCRPVHVEGKLKPRLVPALAAPLFLFSLPDLLNNEGR
jgi:hypothetical protein